MPDSMSSCGDCSAPAHSRTSRRQRSCLTWPPFEQHPQHARLGDDLEVGPASHRRQIGLGRAAALAVVMRDLVQAHALLAGAVEIGVVRMAGLHTRLHKSLSQRIRVTQIGHMQRATAAMQRIGTARVALRLLEIRQNIAPAPARIALCPPVFIVLGLSAHIDHGVDGAGSAQHLAARLIAPAAAEPGLRHRAHGPVEVFLLGHQRQARGTVDQHAAVLAAGLQQTHAHLRVLAQPRRQHGSRRAASDHQIVAHALLLLVAADSGQDGAAAKQGKTRSCGKTLSSV